MGHINDSRGSQWLPRCISGGSKPTGGWGIDPFPDVSRRRHAARRRGNGRERYLQNPWRGVIPVAGRMHLGVTHGGRKGRGRGIGPLTWASRHRRGGLPNKVIGGRPPSHGAGGHLMHGARGAEKGGEGQDESRREQEGEPQLPFPLADAGVRRLCTQARPSPGPSGWTGPNPAG